MLLLCSLPPTSSSCSLFRNKDRPWYPPGMSPLCSCAYILEPSQWCHPLYINGVIRNKDHTTLRTRLHRLVSICSFSTWVPWRVDRIDRGKRKFCLHNSRSSGKRLMATALDRGRLLQMPTARRFFGTARRIFFGLEDPIGLEVLPNLLQCHGDTTRGCARIFFAFFSTKKVSSHSFLAPKKSQHHDFYLCKNFL